MATDIYTFNLQLTAEQVTAILEDALVNSSQIKYLDSWWDLARTSWNDDALTVPTDFDGLTVREWIAEKNVHGARVRRQDAGDDTVRQFALIDKLDGE